MGVVSAVAVGSQRSNKVKAGDLMELEVGSLLCIRTLSMPWGKPGSQSLSTRLWLEFRLEVASMKWKEGSYDLSVKLEPVCVYVVCVCWFNTES